MKGTDSVWTHISPGPQTGVSLALHASGRGAPREDGYRKLVHTIPTYPRDRKSQGGSIACGTVMTQSRGEL